jgi:hypothetical protein
MEDEPLLAERGLAEDQRGDQRHRVRLEQVGGHAGTVTHVVADVVSDRGGVARVVLGDTLLDLADQVGADVSGLGEDAAADPHEHGEQRGAEAEPLEHGRSVGPEQQHHQRRTEQAEAHGEEADDAAGTERDLHRLLAAAVFVGRRRDAHVGAGGQRHAGATDEGGEDRADHEERRAADLDGRLIVAGFTHGKQEQQDNRDDDEDRKRLELADEIGRGALLDSSGDFLHLRGASAGRQHRSYERAREAQRHKGDDHRDDDIGQIGTGKGDLAGCGEFSGHSLSSCTDT